MKGKSYFWHCGIWFLAGSLLGTYLPYTALALGLHNRASQFVSFYPLYLQVPFLTFLIVVAWKPVTDLLRRYRHNWQPPTYVFTPVEGFVSFCLGALFSGLLNGSIPHSQSSYSHLAVEVGLVWGGAILALVLGAFISSLTEKSEAPETSVRDSLVDVPITNDSEDLLGRVRFVEQYYEQLTKFVSNDSFVFGLNGAWGTGKTSTLNLLRNRLRKDPHFILVEFNPWYFQSAETVIRRFYETVGYAVNEKFYYPSLSSAVRRYARILAPTLKHYGVDFDWSQEPNVTDVKKLVESYIANSGRRVVVIIDDLERASGDELLAVLQTVRLSANFQNTLFILAYDQAQICAQLESNKISAAFLEKIIQSPQELPAADQSEIDRFLIYTTPGIHTSHIDQLLDKLGIEGIRRQEFDKVSSELYASILFKFFPTFRNAKRLMTSFSVRLPVVKDEINLRDFFLLEILRTFANTVYQDILNNPYYYLPVWTDKAMMASPFGLELDEKDKESTRKKVRAHVDELLSAQPHKDEIRSILKILFPARIEESFGRQMNYGEAYKDASRSDKKIAHPECFDKYFLLAVPKGTVSDSKVENILQKWTNASAPEKTIAHDLEEMRSRAELVPVLDRIVIFLARLDPKIVNPLLEALARETRPISPDQDRSEQDSAFRLILFLLDRKIEDSKKQTAFYSVLHNVGALEVGIRLVGALDQGKSEVVWSLRQTVDVAEAKQILVERFRRDYVDKGTNIFETNCQWGYVLFQIGSYSAETASMINAYVFSLLGTHSSYIGRLIDGFYLEILGDGPSGFQLKELKRVYDAERLADLARESGQGAIENPKQGRAVEAFQKLMAQEPPTPKSQLP
jgi:hypothetical protein